jgi:hypothetical protein
MMYLVLGVVAVIALATLDSPINMSMKLFSSSIGTSNPIPSASVIRADDALYKVLQVNAFHKKLFNVMAFKDDSVKDIKKRI